MSPDTPFERLEVSAYRIPASSFEPDLSRPGIGLELKRKDAERYAI